MSLKDNLPEMGFGCVAGIVGQLFCHPFDTIKTRQQENSKYSIIRDIKFNGWRTLYRGLPLPLMGIIPEKLVLFYSYTWFQQNLDLKKYGFGETSTTLFNGFCAGGLTTITNTPFERVKTVIQVNENLKNQNTFGVLQHIVRTNGVLSLYRGFSALWFREVPGYAMYFTIYEKVKKQLGGQLQPWQSFLTGSACGMGSWLVIMPSDPVKTKMQAHNISAPRAIQQIMVSDGIPGFYRGFRACLARAGILHGGVFLGYETSKQFWNNTFCNNKNN